MGTNALATTSPQSDPSLLQLSSFTSVQPNNSSLSIIDALVSQNSRQIRVLVIAISALNITAALAVVFSILKDAISAQNKNISCRKHQPFHLPISIHPAEVFPFFLSTAVFTQGIIFIVVQSGGLQKEFVIGCRRTAETVWPTIWIVAYTTLVFALETTFRSLQRNRFRPRGQWNTLICLTAIILSILGTFLPALLLPSPNRCLATLVWWTEHYALIAVILGSGVIFLFLLSAVIIMLQLLRTVKIDRDERIAATRIVYYLIVSVFTIALILPFYVQILRKRLALGTSHMADIVLNLSGLIAALIHLFFRSNADRLAIRPINTPWSENRRFRFFGPNDLSIPMVISTPLLIDGNEIRSNMVPNEKPPGLPAPIGDSSNPRVEQIDRLHPNSSQAACNVDLVRPPKVAQRPGQIKSTYSIFPTRASARPLSWSTIRSGSSEVIPLPRPLFARGHRRDDSNQTSETVQIGMRLSHAIYEDSLPTEDQVSAEILETDISFPYQDPHQSQPPGLKPAPVPSGPLAPSPLNPLQPLQRSSFPIPQPPDPSQESRRLMKSLPPIPRIPNRQTSYGLQSHPPNESTWPLASGCGLSEAKQSWI